MQQFFIAYGEALFWLLAIALLLIPLDDKLVDRVITNPLRELTEYKNITWVIAFYVCLSFAAGALGWHGTASLIVTLTQIYVTCAVILRIVAVALGLREPLRRSET